MFTTTDFYWQTGFVKTEQVKSGIYLTPTSEKETISYLLTTLALTYVKTFGMGLYVDADIKGMLKQFSDMKVMERGTLTLTSHPAVQTMYSASVGDYKVRIFAAFIEVKGKIAAITCLSLEENYSLYEPAFNNAIRMFIFRL